MEKVLVVVDMQTRFLRECGAQAVVPRVAEKIVQRRKEGYEICLTFDRSGGATDPQIAAVCRGCKTYVKRSYGCRQLILDFAENRPSTVEFVGVCTDICVIANVLGVCAFLPYADISVDASCCRAATRRGHLAALRVMKACRVGINGPR